MSSMAELMSVSLCMTFERFSLMFVLLRDCLVLRALHLIFPFPVFRSEMLNCRMNPVISGSN